ncbi:MULTISPECIES: chaperone NapD [unclassified Campylobacter]|uniref:chaperone NapD n=1 Tax=unclassified Campylobacter TaxID=2593542 RepID=UPI003D35831E
MNISSLIVYTKDETSAENVIPLIENVDGCEVVAAQDGKIVVVVSVENLDEEIEKFKVLEKLEGVSSAAMIYSYQEDLQNDIESIKKSGKISEILLDENIDARNIIYNGHIGDRVK